MKPKPHFDQKAGHMQLDWWIYQKLKGKNPSLKSCLIFFVELGIHYWSTSRWYLFNVFHWMWMELLLLLVSLKHEIPWYIWFSPHLKKKKILSVCHKWKIWFNRGSSSLPPFVGRFIGWKLDNDIPPNLRLFSV